jgi:hypothetical protein
LQIKFPRDQYTTTVAGMSEAAPVALKDAKKLSRVQFDLHPGAEVKVEGYGIPFANPEHPSHAWINDDAPIIAICRSWVCCSNAASCFSSAKSKST